MLLEKETRGWMKKKIFKLGKTDHFSSMETEYSKLLAIKERLFHLRYMKLPLGHILISPYKDTQQQVPECREGNRHMVHPERCLCTQHEDTLESIPALPCRISVCSETLTAGLQAFTTLVWGHLWSYSRSNIYKAAGKTHRIWNCLGWKGP